MRLPWWSRGDAGDRAFGEAVVIGIRLVLAGRPLAFGAGQRVAARNEASRQDPHDSGERGIRGARRVDESRSPLVAYIRGMRVARCRPQSAPQARSVSR